MVIHLIPILGFIRARNVFLLLSCPKADEQTVFGQLSKGTTHLPTPFKKIEKMPPQTEHRFRGRTSKILFQVKSKVIKTANG